jgi:hypothetical protein
VLLAEGANGILLDHHSCVIHVLTSIFVISVRSFLSSDGARHLIHTACSHMLISIGGQIVSRPHRRAIISSLFISFFQ